MLAGREKNDQMEQINKLEDSYFKTLFFVKQNMLKYAQDQEMRGNLDRLVKRVIMKTGAPGKLFKSIKFHLFGLRDTEVEQIEIQHNMRKQMKKSMHSLEKQNSDLKSPAKVSESKKNSKKQKDKNSVLYD